MLIERSNRITESENTWTYNRGQEETGSDSKTICLQLGLQGSRQSGPICTITDTHTYIYTSFIVQVTTLHPCEGEYLSGGRWTLEDWWGIVGLSWCGLSSTDPLGPAGFDAVDELSWGGAIVSKESELRLDLYLMWSTWRLMMQSLSSSGFSLGFFWMERSIWFTQNPFGSSVKWSLLHLGIVTPKITLCNVKG